jgi:hypothetical protein
MMSALALRTPAWNPGFWVIVEPYGPACALGVGGLTGIARPAQGSFLRSLHRLNSSPIVAGALVRTPVTREWGALQTTARAGGGEPLRIFIGADSPRRAIGTSLAKDLATRHE